MTPHKIKSSTIPFAQRRTDEARHIKARLNVLHRRLEQIEMGARMGTTTMRWRSANPRRDPAQQRRLRPIQGHLHDRMLFWTSPPKLSHRERVPCCRFLEPVILRHSKSNGCPGAPWAGRRRLTIWTGENRSALGLREVSSSGHLLESGALRVVWGMSLGRARHQFPFVTFSARGGSTAFPGTADLLSAREIFRSPEARCDGSVPVEARKRSLTASPPFPIALVVSRLSFHR